MVQGCLQGRCNATLVSGCCASRGFPTPWEVMVLSENEREQRVHSETRRGHRCEARVAQCSQMRTSPRSLWGLLQVPYHRNSSWISEESINYVIQCLSGQQMAQKYIETENAVGCLYAPKSSKIKDHDAILFCMQSIQDSHSARTSKNTMSGEC